MIGQQFLCYFTSTSIADSENHYKIFKNAENQLSAVFIFMTRESSAKSVKGVPLDEYFSYQRTFVEFLISICNCCFDTICIQVFFAEIHMGLTFLICVFVNLVFHDSF